MNTTRTYALVRRMESIDTQLCLLFNRGAHRPLVNRFFALVSRLGDGLFWYALMAVLALAGGRAGVVAALHMAAVGLAGVLIYKLLKGTFVRQRPFAVVQRIRLGTAPLDRYSFPSGHTLHAVAFTLVACFHFPTLTPFLAPFTALVALSRPVLGLHYPSDVIAGAAIGAALATASLQWFV